MHEKVYNPYNAITKMFHCLPIPEMLTNQTSFKYYDKVLYVHVHLYTNIICIESFYAFIDDIVLFNGLTPV